MGSVRLAPSLLQAPPQVLHLRIKLRRGPHEAVPFLLEGRDPVGARSLRTLINIEKTCENTEKVDSKMKIKNEMQVVIVGK